MLLNQGHAGEVKFNEARCTKHGERKMKQPLIDLKIQYQNIKKEIDDAVHKVLDRSDFILGKEVKELERQVSQYVGVNHAIGVASGTDALKVALQALNIGAGDEVITTPFTFIATGESIHQVGQQNQRERE